MPGARAVVRSRGGDSAPGLLRGWPPDPRSPVRGVGAVSGDSARSLPCDDLADIGLGSDSVCARPSSHRIKSFDSLGPQPSHGRTSKLFQGQYRSLVSVRLVPENGSVLGSRACAACLEGHTGLRGVAQPEGGLPLLPLLLFSGLTFAHHQIIRVSCFMTASKKSVYLGRSILRYRPVYLEGCDL